MVALLPKNSAPVKYSQPSTTKMTRKQENHDESIYKHKKNKLQILHPKGAKQPICISYKEATYIKKIVLKYQPIHQLS